MAAKRSTKSNGQNERFILVERSPEIGEEMNFPLDATVFQSTQDIVSVLEDMGYLADSWVVCRIEVVGVIDRGKHSFKAKK